jgi:hypothetical protein
MEDITKSKTAPVLFHQTLDRMWVQMMEAQELNSSARVVHVDSGAYLFDLTLDLAPIGDPMQLDGAEEFRGVEILDVRTGKSEPAQV